MNIFEHDPLLADWTCPICQTLWGYGQLECCDKPNKRCATCGMTENRVGRYLGLMAQMNDEKEESLLDKLDVMWYTLEQNEQLQVESVVKSGWHTFPHRE